MQNQVLVVLGADGELVLCWVEDVEQQMTLAGAVDRHRHKDCNTSVKSLSNQKLIAGFFKMAFLLGVFWYTAMCINFNQDFTEQYTH